MRTKSLREWFGVLFLDFPRYEMALANWFGNKSRWLALRNRKESLTHASNFLGFRCDWRWTSKLHAVGVVPSWGRRLLQKALAHYPITLASNVEFAKNSDVIDVTFIIGHRGRERLPLLLATLSSIANQSCGNLECIIVEESFDKEVERDLPDWVKYIHLFADSKDQPYNRSRTFNAGASAARGKLFVFHDNDMLVPTCYADELLEHLGRGYEVINLKRFIFYLTKSHTEKVIDSGRITFQSPEFVLQNLTGGGSLAIEKDAYYRIGGFDEGFVGWGGEDVEFWDRAQTLNVNNYGYLPIIHLWHAPQPEKNDQKDSAAMQRLDKLLMIDAQSRIDALRHGSPQ